MKKKRASVKCPSVYAEMGLSSREVTGLRCKKKKEKQTDLPGVKDISKMHLRNFRDVAWEFSPGTKYGKEKRP